jgi:protocatechuate 3,4-dioxygenase beta subunit
MRPVAPRSNAGLSYERRALLAAGAACAIPLLARSGFGPQRPATPACGPDAATEAQTEGPYFQRNSPERASLLEPGLAGERLVLGGQVLGSDCRPVAHALLDVWQADADGAYDNRGQRLRGHLFTDADGRYRLETIVPGLYPGRTRHIHVKLQPPGGRVLTTQLYFPDEAANRRDGLFEPSLRVTLKRDAGAAQAAFDFVLRRA